MLKISTVLLLMLCMCGCYHRETINYQYDESTEFNTSQEITSSESPTLELTTTISEIESSTNECKYDIELELGAEMDIEFCETANTTNIYLINVNGYSYPYVQLTIAPKEYLSAGYIQIIENHETEVLETGNNYPYLPKGHAEYYNYAEYEQYLVCEFNTDMFMSSLIVEENIPDEYRTETFWCGIIINENRNESYWIYLNQRVFTKDDIIKALETLTVEKIEDH